MGPGALSSEIMAMTPEEFWQILHDAPEIKPVFYRLYHDEQGHPIAYSMDDLPGNYIEIDAETYARSSGQVRVINGQLVEIEKHSVQLKLKPSADQGFCCHPWDVCVIVDEYSPHRKWKMTDES